MTDWLTKRQIRDEADQAESNKAEETLAATRATEDSDITADKKAKKAASTKTDDEEDNVRRLRGLQ
jgi:hypothetical protein